MRQIGWLVLVGGFFLVWAAGGNQPRADGDIILRDGEGNPIECEPGGGVDCDTRPKPNWFIGNQTIADCEPLNPYNEQSMNLEDCADANPVGFPTEVIFENGAAVGLRFVSEDLSQPHCLGATEDTESIGMIDLAFEPGGPDRAAKIYWFVEHPLGPSQIQGSSNPPGVPIPDTAVHITLNEIELEIPTTWNMTANDLNQSIDQQLRAQFVVIGGIDGFGRYWVVHRAPDYSSIQNVAVRADDPGLLTMRVELTDDPTASCGF